MACSYTLRIRACPRAPYTYLSRRLRVARQPARVGRAICHQGEGRDAEQHRRDAFDDEQPLPAAEASAARSRQVHPVTGAPTTSDITGPSEKVAMTRARASAGTSRSPRAARRGRSRPPRCRAGSAGQRRRSAPRPRPWRPRAPQVTRMRAIQLAGVREHARLFLEDHRAEHVHVAGQEVARGLTWHAALDHLVHDLLHDDQQCGADRFAQAGLEQRRQLHRDAMRAHHRAQIALAISSPSA